MTFLTKLVYLWKRVLCRAVHIQLVKYLLQVLPYHKRNCFSFIFVGVMQVCVRCIFRIFGVHEFLYSSATLSTSLLYSNIRKGLKPEGELNINGSQANKDPNNVDTSLELMSEDYVCRICLGILQFVYYDQGNVLVKRDSARDFALTIADVVKRDGHVADNFSLEVSMPPLILENEESVL